MAELLFQSKQETLTNGQPIIITKVLGAIDGTTVRQFEEKLIGFFDQGIKHLILVFSEVKYINSTGMGLLVKIADKFQEGGGEIKLVGVPEKVIALFDMLGLLTLFKLYEKESDAIQSIGPTANSNPDPPQPAPVPTPAVGIRPGLQPSTRPPVQSVQPPPRQPHVPTPLPTSGIPPKRPGVPSTTGTPPMGVTPVVAPPPSIPRPTPHGMKQQEGAYRGNPMTASALGIPKHAPAVEDNVSPMVVEVPTETETSAAWPYHAQCQVCNSVIEFPSPGRFQCPRCHCYISVSQNREVQTQASFNANVVEMKLPCGGEFIGSVKSIVNSMAMRVRFSSVFFEEIEVAIDTALTIMLEKTENPYDTFQIIMVADENEMILGIKALCAFVNLSQGGPKDPRLQIIARKVTKLEIFPLPTKGQLLKITKQRK